LATELRDLEGRIQVLDALLDALERQGAVQHTVQLASDRQSALKALQDPPYCYTQLQAEAVLDMPVAWHCTGEVERIRTERQALAARRADLRDNAFDTFAFHWFG
jgi:DNA gyrase/topoisomerase IV subunit A